MARSDIILEALIVALRNRVDWFKDWQADARDGLCDDGFVATRADMYGIDASEINLRDVATEIDVALQKSGQS